MVGSGVWTRETGWVALEPLPPEAVSAWLSAVSADGSIGAGTVHFDPPLDRRPIVWNRAHGVRDLAELLEAAGLDLGSWRLLGAADVSADGRTVVGTGINPQGDEEGWVAVLPPPDLDADGIEDDADTCPSTAPGAVVDPANGCSVSQLCTCDDGLPVACTAKLAQDFVSRGLIGRDERVALIREATRCARD
jgi:hypothetical protein